MLPAFSDTPIPFPQVGARAFLKTSAEPVTIIRRNQDGTALVRCDPRPGEGPHRDASGNREEPLADLFPTEAEAAQAGRPALLTPSERHILQEVDSTPEKAARATLLQACTPLTQSGFHRVLNKLIRRGLVDRRGALIAISAAGATALAGAK